MSKLQAFVRQYFTPIIMLLLAGGFAVILVELYSYHHWRGSQLIGLVATIAGLLLVLVGIFAKRGLRITVAVLLVALSVSGLIGTYEHYESSHEERGEAAQPALVQAAPHVSDIMVAYQLNADTARTVAQEGGEQGEGGEQDEAGGQSAAPQAAPRQGRSFPERGFEIPAPLLAPLGISGLALIGAVVLLAKKDETVPAKGK